jgi:transcriptional regulator with XRE-family HTH domain
MIEPLKPYERLKEERSDLGLTQSQMAEALGMSLRGYQDLEAGKSEYRKIHQLAVERLGLKLAVERNDLTLAGVEIRRDIDKYIELLQRRGY